MKILGFVWRLLRYLFVSLWLLPNNGAQTHTNTNTHTHKHKHKPTHMSFSILRCHNRYIKLSVYSLCVVEIIHPINSMNSCSCMQVAYLAPSWCYNKSRLGSGQVSIGSVTSICEDMLHTRILLIASHGIEQMGSTASVTRCRLWRICWTSKGSKFICDLLTVPKLGGIHHFGMLFLRTCSYVVNSGVSKRCLPAPAKART